MYINFSHIYNLRYDILRQLCLKCEETNQILTVIQLIKLWGILTTFMFIDELQWVNLIGLISELHVKKQSNKLKFIYITQLVTDVLFIGLSK